MRLGEGGALKAWCWLALRPPAQTPARLRWSTLLAPLARLQVYCATSPGIARGEYYADVNLQPSSKLAHSRTLAETLWALSERMVAGTYRQQQRGGSTPGAAM